MQNLNNFYRTLMELIKLPTPNAEKLKEISIDFDKVAEKLKDFSPELKRECGILFAKSLHKYGILK